MCISPVTNYTQYVGVHDLAFLCIKLFVNDMTLFANILTLWLTDILQKHKELVVKKLDML